jgi:DNA-binding transcriptional MerR regulator
MDREFVLPTDSEKLPHRAIFDAIRRRRQEAEMSTDAPVESTVERDEVFTKPAAGEFRGTITEVSAGFRVDAPEAEVPIDHAPEEMPAEPEQEVELELEAVAKIPSESENASLPHPTIPPKPLRFPEGKKYFRIAEAAELLGVEAGQLRRWEQHFGSIVKPERHGGQRVYRRKDIRALHLIRHMILEEHYTVADARRYYRARRRALDEQAGVERQRAIESLEATARELRELVRLVLHG